MSTDESALTRVQLALSDRVQAGAEGFPAPWNLIIAASFSLDDRAFSLTAESANQIVQDILDHGADVVVDFEHATEKLGGAGQRAPACGWIACHAGNFSFDPARGLLARITWLPETREDIQSGRYGYLSPSVSYRKDTGLITALHSVGLTNRPATPGLERVAASRNMESTTMAQQGSGTTKPGSGGPTPPGSSTPAGIAPEKMGRVRELLKELSDLLGANSIDELVEAIKAIDQAESEMDREEMRATMRREVEAEILSARRADDLLHPWVQKHWITDKTDSKEYLSLRRLAAFDPELFDMHMRMCVQSGPPQGRTTPPKNGAAADTERGSIIRQARATFRADPNLAKVTSEDAITHLALRDAGLPGLFGPDGTRKD